MNFIDLIKKMNQRDSIFESTDKVGIFWIEPDTSKIFMDYQELRDLAKSYDEYKLVDVSHSTYWNSNDALVPKKYKDKMYSYVPRGRVIWDDYHKKTLIFMNKRYISNEITIKDIVSKFNLCRYEFLYDAHYDLIR